MTRTAQLRDQRQKAGDWLRSALEQANLSTGAVAARLGVHQTSVSGYVNGRSSVPEDRVEDLARILRTDVVTVRRGLGYWVPEGYEPRMVRPEEAIRADPTLRPDQKETALGMLALIRGQPAPPPPVPLVPPGEYDPDAPPWQPGDH